MSSDLLAAASTTARAIASAESARQALVSRRGELVTERDHVIVAIHNAVDAEKRDAGRRLLDGPDASLPNARRKEKVSALREKWDAHDAAISLLDKRIDDSSIAVVAARAAHAPKVLSLCCEIKVAALERTRSAIAALAPALAEIVAAQKLQDAVIGTSFEIPLDVDQAALFNGTKVVERLVRGLPGETIDGLAKLIGGLPGRFVAEGFTFEAIVAIATESASKLQLKINGETS